MITHMLNIGTSGVMEIRETSDEETSTPFAELYLSSSDPISIPNLKWWSTIDGDQSDLSIFDFKPVTTRQHIGLIYLPVDSETLIWHIENTGTIQLDGDVDFSISLFISSSLASVRIKDGGVWKQAIPYVNDGGVWKSARAYIKNSDHWIPL